MLEQVLTVKNTADMQLPLRSSLVNFSLLSDISCRAAFRSFSIKYVCTGVEKYTVNGNAYFIRPGEYLLANHFAEGTVEIEETVKGICIDIAPDLLSEVVAAQLRPDTGLPDIALDKFFNTNAFLDNKYNAGTTSLGRFLSAFDKEMSLVKDAPVKAFRKELYYNMAECIVADHIPVITQLQHIKKLKPATRKDLYRRVQTGRAYIDSCFLNTITMESVARVCSLSEYHFFRIFKQVYGISPYQYVIKKRIEFAKEILKDGRHQITEVAYAAGFTDLFTFSKIFKKHVGIAPSKYGLYVK